MLRVLLLALAIALAASASINAVAVLYDPSGSSGVKGVIRFTQQQRQNTVSFEGSISGLKDGKHGFHIHEFGDFTNGCTSAGAHFNPFNRSHGGPDDYERHVGDLGNVEARQGIANVRGEDHQIQLVPGTLSIIGRSVVVHADPDDLGRGGHPDSKTTGHAGARLACGVIGYQSTQQKRA